MPKGRKHNSETSDEDVEYHRNFTAADKHRVVNGISLDVFGFDPSSENKQGGNIHEGLASRWNHMIKKGLDEEILKTLIERYPPPANCALTPPKLNAEISDTLEDTIIRVDEFLQKFQSQIAAGLAALGGIIQENLSETVCDNRSLLEKLADPAKILADLFHSISLHRRFLIEPVLDPYLSKHIGNIEIDEFLFGSELMQKVRELQSSGSASNQVNAAVESRPPNSSVPRTSTGSRGPSEDGSSKKGNQNQDNPEESDGRTDKTTPEKTNIQKSSEISKMDLSLLNQVSCIEIRPYKKLQDLEVGKPQQILDAKILATTFGDSVLLTLQDCAVFLPHRVVEKYRPNIEHFSSGKYDLVYLGSINTGMSNPTNNFKIIEHK